MQRFERIMVAAASAAGNERVATDGVRLRQVPGLAVTRSVGAKQEGVTATQLQRRMQRGIPDPTRAWTITVLATGESAGVYFASAAAAGRFAQLMRASGVSWETVKYEGLSIARSYRRAFNKAITCGPLARRWSGRVAEVSRA